MLLNQKPSGSRFAKDIKLGIRESSRLPPASGMTERILESHKNWTIGEDY